MGNPEIRDPPGSAFAFARHSGLLYPRPTYGFGTRVFGPCDTDTDGDGDPGPDGDTDGDGDPGPDGDTDADGEPTTPVHVVPFNRNTDGATFDPEYDALNPGDTVAFVGNDPFHDSLRNTTTEPDCVNTEFHDCETR